MGVAAILLAAGAGVRMGAGMPKALLPLAGRPLLAWSLRALAESEDVTDLIIVVPEGYARDTEAGLGAAMAGGVVVTGGASRAESVERGLGAAPEGCDRVLVHDAARPLLTPDLVAAVLGALDGADGAIAAAPVSDTLKRQGDDLEIADTVAREGMWAAQTPQAFWRSALAEAIERAVGEGRLDAATDCASLVEAVGGTVRLVHSPSPNPKVTIPTDLEYAEWLLGRSDERVR